MIDPRLQRIEHLIGLLGTVDTPIFAYWTGRSLDAAASVLDHTHRAGLIARVFRGIYTVHPTRWHLEYLRNTAFLIQAKREDEHQLLRKAS